MERFPAELGRFRIDGELGRGGMGVVYRAFDPVVERPVAIKTIRCADGFGPQSLERLRREAKAVGSLEHVNIVTLFDAGGTEGIFYLVMQLVEGETLRERMDRRPQFQCCEILDIFRQLLAALEYAHARGIIHRDVKPSNVLITPEGTVKLADFGVARLAGPGISTNGMVLGTPSYMPPEQLLGTPVDGRSDIFAAGCILYELVTGQKAFTGSSTTAVMYQILHADPPLPGAVVPGIRPSIEAAIMKSLAKDPDERFASCAEMLCALETCLAEGLPNLTDSRRRDAPPRRTIAVRVARLFAILKRRPAALAGGVLGTVALLSPAVVLAPSRNPPLPEPARQPQVRSELPPEPQATPVQEPEPVIRRPSKPHVRRPAVVAAIPLITVKPAISPAEPDSFSSLMVKGDLAFQQDHYEEALQSYRKALEFKPADAMIRRKLAITLTLLGQPESARKYHR
jgi:serine/threonine-protein kinase